MCLTYIGSFHLHFLDSDNSDAGLGSAKAMAHVPKKKTTWSLEEETIMWKHLQVIVFVHLYLYHINQIIFLQFICLAYFFV